MNSVLPSLFSAVLATCKENVISAWAWPSVDAAFAWYVNVDSQALVQSNMFPTPVGGLWPSSHPLHEAPTLAIAGYVLEMQKAEATEARRTEWVAGLQRLSEKRAFADYQFFAYNPMEVLGIALGISACTESAPFRAWFGTVVNRVLKERADDFWTQFLIGLAAWKADVISLPNIRVAHNTAPLDELATARWLVAVHPNMPAVSSLSKELPVYDGALLKRCCIESLPPPDVGRHALLHYAITAAINDRIDSALAETWQVNRGTKDAEKVIISLCRRFHLFAMQIKQRRAGRPTIEMTDEYDVQDAMYALLKLHFDDVRPEEVAPSYAGKSTRIDFILKHEKIAIETKMMRDSLKQNDVVNELIEDKERYRTHPDMKTLICLIYDPTQKCRTPIALENDVSSDTPDLRCVVIVTPKGL